MKHPIALAGCLWLWAFGVAFAEGTPDFSGTWRLDVASSAVGAHGALREATLVQKQTGSQLTVETGAGDRAETAVYRLDGGESVHALRDGRQVKSTTKWAGGRLITRSTKPSGQGADELTAARSLSADGKVMTIDLTWLSAAGEVKQKLVYNKQ